MLAIPSIEALLGRMVTAPSATSSWSRIGEIFAPQLSEPTNWKCPVRLAFFAASRTRLHGGRRLIIWSAIMERMKDYKKLMLATYKSNYSPASLKRQTNECFHINIVELF